MTRLCEISVACFVLLALGLSSGSLVVGEQTFFALQAPKESENSPLVDPILFNLQIRPILSQYCISCHGPDEGHREADLRLDIRNEALAVIQPDSPEDSELIARIMSHSDDRMPPPEHGEPLKSDDVELIRRWIEQGAPYETHWSFVAPQKPSVPKFTFDEWARNEIDHFIAAELRRQQLQPSADGDPYRLIRRLALDLTGLPPTREMCERFADNSSDELFEQIVDELLHSSAYGEHWAATWLDIARYADTVGYAEDSNRDIWPWRDWVIRALNTNMPYDQFTIEQIAGDLLLNATESQKLATAFHRNTLNNTEGGTNDEEFRVLAVKDRINTTINVWMGLTMRCAECHTHKYDPISQVEYYQFLDFFNQTADADFGDDRPHLGVNPLEGPTSFDELGMRVQKLQEEIANEPEVWTCLGATETGSRDGTKFDIQDDRSILPVGKNPRFDEYHFTLGLPAGKHTGLRLEVIPDPSVGGYVGRGSGGEFVISQIRASTIDVGSQIETRIKFSTSSADYSKENSGIKLTISDRPAIEGWSVTHPVEGNRAKRTAVLEFAKALELEQPTSLKLYILHASPWPKSNVGRVRISSTSFASPAIAFKENRLDPRRWELEQLIKEQESYIRVPVMQELPDSHRRESFVNIRGNYQSHGDQVYASVPAAFHPLPPGAPVNRLGIAQWLMSKENPLAARVTVNRYWARLFGVGIVETEEDFGTQGAQPVNQPLLDWLAVDLRDHGWDIKRLLKQMVMSSAYRQDNRATAEHLAKDPRNRYLARGPRFRLSAEVVRDQALAVSGLLSDKLFGPPVFPPSPIKRIVNAFTGGMTWNVSEGDDRYRRAVYTFLKRSSPHPLFATFDMASRSVCNIRRIRTNTPLQAFMTLNDETFIEAARALAVSMQQQAGRPDAQIQFGLETALLHPAREDHMNELVNLYELILKEYRYDNPGAAKIAGVSESADDNNDETLQLASLTVVANVILNLDEFLTR